MTEQEMRDMIEKLKAENTELRTKRNTPPPLTLKVSQKGACSLYGIGRFPVTLYGSQWERVLDHGDKIREFLNANASQLATKEKANSNEE